MTNKQQVQRGVPNLLKPVDPEEAANRRQQLEERRLTDHAYSQRRAMLLMAAITFAISWGGVRLSAIDMIGIQITSWNERYLLAFASIILAYLIGNFAALVQPVISAWRSDFDWFALDANRVVKMSTNQIVESFRDMRSALEEMAHSESVQKMLEHLDNGEKIFSPSRIQRYADKYLELHKSRLRFEYSVPVGISISVLYLAIPRLIVLYLQ